MSETALAVVEDAVVVASPLDMVPATFKAGLERRGENRKTLLAWLKDALVEGVDYGYIHIAGKSKCQLAQQGKAGECKDPSHWSPKPSLWKSGAEKICGMLDVIPTYPNLHKYEDAALNGIEIRSIILRCEIVSHGGHVLSQGVGARSLAQDYGDLNKSLKMAKKSSHIDGTLGIGGLSEVFTLDLEDMPAGSVGDGDVKDKPAPAGGIGRERAIGFMAWAEGLGIARPHVINAARKYHQVDDLAKLTEAQARELMNHLKSKAAAKPDPGPVPNGGQDGHPTDDSQASEQQPTAEEALFPEATGEEAERYPLLARIAAENGIPETGSGKITSLAGLIRMCWPDRGDTDLARMPADVAEKVDARMTEIIAARAKA